MDFNPANRKAIALLLVVFLLGIALGALGHIALGRRTFAARTRDRTNGQPHLVSRMTRELNLTADQQKQLSNVLMDMQRKFAAVRQQMTPQFEQIRNQGHDQIRQMLTPQQRPKFEDFLRRLAAEHGKRPDH
jgi:Spy/CpxP family protein refolding chaperone